MTYQEYKEQRQNEFNNLPIFYAFSVEQLEKALNERGTTLHDAEIYTIGNGGFYLRSDADKVREWINKPDPIKELMESPDFAEDAFYYEMGNHEYHINHYQGDWDVCSCFGECEYGNEKTYVDYLKEMGYSETVVSAFTRAKKRFWNYVIEHDLF